MRTHRLASLTWPEVRDAVDAGGGVILPVGATEQHGTHLPLDTDAVLAEQLGFAIAGDTGMLVAPPVTYGYRSRPLSGGGEGFPGTTSVSARTLMSVVEDVLSALIRTGFRRLMVLNWHMENANFVYEAAYLAQQASLASPGPALAGQPGPADEPVRIMVLEAAFAELSQPVMDAMFGDVAFTGWDVEHAAILETSLMLHLQPERVLFERAVDDRSLRHPTYDLLLPPPDFLTASGSLSISSRSTAAKGQAAWAEITDRVRVGVTSELGSVVL